MKRSILQVYIHFNWHVKNNAPIIAGELESFIHRIMRETVEELGLLMLAINSAWNHTHSLVGWNTTVTIEKAVRIMKSQTSRQWNTLLREGKVSGPHLQWQRGIGAMSIHRSLLTRTVQYIDQQKEHHGSGRLIDELEII